MRTRRRLTAAVLLLLLLLFLFIIVLILTQETEDDSPDILNEATATEELTFGIVAIPGNTVITLEWSDINAAGYYVYRDGSETPLNAEPITVTTYQDIGLTNGKTYQYVVVAIDSSSSPFEMVEAIPRSDAS